MTSWSSPRAKGPPSMVCFFFFFFILKIYSRSLWICTNITQNLSVLERITELRRRKLVAPTRGNRFVYTPTSKSTFLPPAKRSSPKRNSPSPRSVLKNVLPAWPLSLMFFVERVVRATTTFLRTDFHSGEAPGTTTPVTAPASPVS